MAPRLATQAIFGFALGVFVSAGPAPARADVIQSYDFSGTLATAIGGDAAVTGTFTIDFTTPSITAFDFSTPIGTVDSTQFSTVITTFTATSPSGQPVVLLAFDDREDGVIYNYFWLQFATTLASLSTDASTPLDTGVTVDSLEESWLSVLVCADTVTCSPEGNSVFSSGTASLVGSTPPVTVPEPGSLALLGTGLAALQLLRRKRVTLG